MPGACNQDGAVYETKVSTSDGRVESYVGLAKNFKKRWRKHKTNLDDTDSDGQTTMSRYVWRKRDEGLAPTVAWSYLEKKFHISTPSLEYANYAQERSTRLFLTLVWQLWTVDRKFLQAAGTDLYIYLSPQLQIN